MIRKLIRNVSGTTCQILNRSVANGETYEIPLSQWMKAADSLSLASDISSGLVVVNNGTSDLSIPDALEYVLRFQQEKAEQVSFDNATNGFTATDAQAAIEEAKQSSVGTLYTQTFVRQGAAGNTWLYSSDSGITTNTTPTIIPFNCKLVSAAISCDSGNRSFDIRMNILKADSGLTVNRSIIYQVRNSRFYSKTDFTTDNVNLLLDAGDKIAIYCQNQGNPPSDLIVTFGFKVNSEINVIKSENTTTSGITVTLGPITIILG